MAVKWKKGAAKTLRAALASFEVLSDSIGLGLCGEEDCFVIGDPRLAELYAGVTSDDALRQLVRVNAERGVDVIKTRGTQRAGLHRPRVADEMSDDRWTRSLKRARVARVLVLRAERLHRREHRPTVRPGPILRAMNSSRKSSPT